MRVDEYIARRIRRLAPIDSNVVAGSTPVVSFGNAQSAIAATLGLNPSRGEFLDRNGQELTGSLRRLTTHQSLGISESQSLTNSHVAQVLQDCNSYFDRNPYRRWFDQLETILNECGSSYYSGSACHLDLVQWATDPTWGKLQADTRRKLLVADTPFLFEQLACQNIRILLINGTGVFHRFRQAAKLAFEDCDPIVGLGRKDTRLFVGTLYDRVRVIAWSTNLQSSFGVTNKLRTEIAKRVSVLAASP